MSAFTDLAAADLAAIRDADELSQEIEYSGDTVKAWVRHDSNDAQSGEHTRAGYRGAEVTILLADVDSPAMLDVVLIEGVEYIVDEVRRRDLVASVVHVVAREIVGIRGRVRGDL